MLVVVCVAWLLLTTPFAVFTLCVPEHSRDRHTFAVQLLVRTFCFLLMYVNHAVNFILYCLTGRKFRAELKEMLRCMMPRFRLAIFCNFCATVVHVEVVLTLCRP